MLVKVSVKSWLHLLRHRISKKVVFFLGEKVLVVLRRHSNQDFNRDTNDALSRNQLFVSPDDQKWDGAAKIIHRRFEWQL